MNDDSQLVPGIHAIRQTCLGPSELREFGLEVFPFGRVAGQQSPSGLVHAFCARYPFGDGWFESRID